MPPNFAEYYDAIIPWAKRLAREMPLLEELARDAGRRVLVPACGTGGHVVALAERGLHVLGFDADEAAVEVAQQKITAAAASINAAHGEARVQPLAMEDAHSLGPAYDAAFCLGNALPGLSAPNQLPAAFRGMAGALRTGGTFFTQNLNFDLRWKEKAPWFPPLSGETAKEEILLVKFADYETEFINFHTMFLAREKPRGAWQSHPRSHHWRPLFKARLIELLTQAGFTNPHCWGDYAQSPFDPEKSNDLLIAATKA